MNEQLFLFLNNFAGISSILDSLVIFFAKYFIFVLVASAVIFLFKEKERFFEKLCVVVGSAVFAWFISQLINELYPVARPFLVFDKANLLFDHGGYDSFPSGHATFVFALAAGVFFYNKLFGWLFIAGAFLVGLSRIIAGVHWPIDVAGGMILGVLTVSVVFFCVNFFKKKIDLPVR